MTIHINSIDMKNHGSRRFSLKKLFYSIAILAWLAVLQTAQADSPHNTSQKSATNNVAAAPRPIETTPALQISGSPDLESLIPELAKNQVVFVGEIHTRYDHHLIQLEIIRRLHAINPDLVIGMESFQQPFQEYLDAYLRGELNEQEMLRRTEYYVRWRYDYRLYAPILRYAQEHKIPVIALNIPMELSKKVGRSGLQSLNEEERAQLPDEIDRTDQDYENRLKEVFNQHADGQVENFEKFLTVQLLWDEGMAQAIADYLESHPGTQMVVLAGQGHLAYGSGIPNRVTRRLPVSTAIVLNSWQENIQPELADYLLLPEEQALPKAGKIGAMLDEDVSKGEVTIASCVPNSPCTQIGMKKGDQILAINEQKITNVADLRILMWDKQPDEKISLVIRRRHWFSSPEELNLQLTLQ